MKNEESAIVLCKMNAIIDLNTPKKKYLYFRKSDWPVSCADPAIFIAFQRKNKNIFIPTDPKMF